MNVSLFVARLVALVYLSVGLGMLVNKAYYQKMIEKWSHESASLHIGGAMALIAGYLLVTYHNVWESSWVVIITLIGWLALVKGVLLLVFPGSIMSVAKLWAQKSMWPVGVVMVWTLGLVLGYFGFLA